MFRFYSDNGEVKSVVDDNHERECECFAEIYKGNKPSGCSILTYNYCIGHECCSSYKTVKQCEQQKADCAARIASLPLEKINHIKSKYGIRI